MMDSDTKEYLIACSIIICVIIGLFIFAFSCGKTPRPIDLTLYGISIKGDMRKGVKFQNTTESAIYIKCVWVYEGETTQFYKLIKPNEYLNMGYIDYQHGFYFYDKEQKILGYERIN